MAEGSKEGSKLTGLEERIGKPKKLTPFMAGILEKITKEYELITRGYESLKGIPFKDYLWDNNPYKGELPPMSIVHTPSERRELCERFQKLIPLVYAALPIIINYPVGDQSKPDATLRDIFEGG